MTTLTIDRPVRLPQTHFRDMDELVRVLLQYRLETELEEELEAAKKAPANSWKNL